MSTSTLEFKSQPLTVTFDPFLILLNKANNNLDKVLKAVKKLGGKSLYKDTKEAVTEIFESYEENSEEKSLEKRCNFKIKVSTFKKYFKEQGIESDEEQLVGFVAIFEYLMEKMIDDMVTDFTGKRFSKKHLLENIELYPLGTE
jgi:predicted HicB family RNase H-like nuclease